MPLVLLFAFVAGILTILSPCILPVIPLVVGTASGGSSRRLIGIVVGFAGTFVAVTVLLAAALAAAGLTTDRLRLLSALLLLLFGATLAIPPMGRWFETRSSVPARVGGVLFDTRPGSGVLGGIVLGGAIGVVWAPCVGPIMAAVIATAVTAGPTPEAAAIALAYAAGAALPLLLVGRLGRRAIDAIGRPEWRARAVQLFGALMMATAVLIATGFDVPLQAAVAGTLPDGWSTALTAVEGGASGEQSGATGGDAEAHVTLEDLGPAPELSGITAWINSEPITLASLRGKVVLVHFWTFGCINCIHVQPYVKAWYDEYADDGLVVVGVHTPELSFEREIGNVRAAVAKADVRFPVALDPDFATWHAYQNRYWPAFYFIDKTGRIRHTHFGEGDYDGSERVIRALLAEEPPSIP